MDFDPRTTPGVYAWGYWENQRGSSTDRLVIDTPRSGDLSIAWEGQCYLWDRVAVTYSTALD